MSSEDSGRNLALSTSGSDLKNSETSSDESSQSSKPQRPKYRNVNEIITNRDERANKKAKTKENESELKKTAHELEKKIEDRKRRGGKLVKPSKREPTSVA